MKIDVAANLRAVEARITRAARKAGRNPEETATMVDKPRSTVATRMSGIREEWLRLTQEEILEPDLAIMAKG